MLSRLRKQHFSIPIISGNIFMLVLITIVAITGVNGVKQVANSNAIALERRREMADIRTMQLLIKSMDNNLINFVYNGDPVNAQAFKNSVPALLEFRSKIALTIETEDDQINFNIINSQTDEYISNFSNNIIPAREIGDSSKLNTLKAESDELISQIDPFIQNMLANYEKKAQDAFQKAHNARNQTVMLVTLLSFVVGVIGLMSGVSIARTISNKTRQIVLASEQLKESEAALKESERFLNNVIEHIPNLVFVKDAFDLRYLRYNRSGAEILGIESSQIIGRDDHELFPVELAEAYQADDKRVLKLGKLVDIPEEPVIDKNNEVRIFHTKKIPILDEKGNPKYLLGISEDITERKTAEDQIRQLNADLEKRVEQRTAQLESSNKELEAFSYSISHDLRAPLRAINGYAQLIKEDHNQGLSPTAINYFDLIRRNAITMGQLVDDLLNFSRLGRQALSKAIVDPAPMINSIIENMKLELTDRHVNFKVDPLPTCNADAVFLKQVYINLISNAIKFSKDKEVSEIEIGYQLLSINGNDDQNSERTVTYFVRDNGSGFDMKYYDKLFGVFQRLHTADTYEGTGVGLAIVSRIVTKHGGRIWADSILGKGATFYFTLEEDLQ